MKTGKWIVMSAAVLMTGSILIAANQVDAPATQPSARAMHHKAKLTKPWSDLTGLTDAQKEQIEQIHATAREQEAQIHAAEHAQAEALLTEEQKAQLKVLEEKPKKPMVHHKKATDESPTTAPAQQ